MKNLILVFAMIVIAFTSCQKQTSEQPASQEQMAKGGKHHNGGGGSNTVPQVTGLTANASGSTVNLTWNPVPNATTYWIYRDQYVPAIITGTNYTDRSVSPGNTYVYSVAAVVSSVLGPKSISVTVTINQ